MFGVRLKPERATTIVALNRLTAHTKEVSELLARALDHNGNGCQNYLTQIKVINEQCNEFVRQVSEQLKHSFITALDREDIYALVMSLTDVLHRLDKFAGRFSRYRPSQCPPEMIRMVDLI
ncbi:MAG TPA: hypothetical protein VKD91_13430, partial [Pyrinomonadaceae bacterium]|nr:hypothetical protein [Pyrinomonadaceae bacterium]